MRKLSSLLCYVHFMLSGFCCLIGRRQANLCFHFAGSGENLPDMAKSRDARMGKKQNSFLFRTASCHFSVEVFLQITNNLSAGDHCQRDIKEAPLYECQPISAQQNLL